MLECLDQLEFRRGSDMPIPEIEEFARVLIQQVRDTTIQSCDRQLQPDAGSAVAKRWRDAAIGGKQGVDASTDFLSTLLSCAEATVLSRRTSQCLGTFPSHSMPESL